MFGQIFSIVKRELRAWFDHPTGYLILIVALVFNAFFYFRSLAVNPTASLRSSFDLLPWLLIFLVPAVTMRLVAEDRKSGTLETTLAQPLSHWTYLLGKLVAGWKFFGIFLLLTLPVVFTLSPYGDFDRGVVIGQYVGAALLALSMVAVGIAASSATMHQVSSFLAGIGLNFLLFIVGYEVVTVSLPAGVRFVAENLSLAAHYQNVTRGVLDVRDVLYFLTLTGSAYAVAAWLLVRQQLSPARARRRRITLGAMLVVVVSVGFNLLGASLRGRIDFTEARVYTLSPATKTMLGSIPDLVTITLYATKELPPQVALLKRDVEDLLRDIRAAGRGTIVSTSLVVEEGTAEMEEARASGVTSVQFNVLKEDSFQAQNGMFGLTVQYADAHETIGYLDRTDDLEYRIARMVKKLTTVQKPAVTLLTGFQDRAGEVAQFRSGLAEFYTVTDTDIATGTPEIAEEVKAAVLVGPMEDLNDAAQQALAQFIQRGGGVLATLNGVEVDPQTLSAFPSPTTNGDLFARYGARVTGQLAADLQQHETISMNSGIFNLLLPYPYWIKAGVARTHAIAGELPHVVLPWAASVERTEGGVYTVEDILTTSEGGVVTDAPFSINPQEQFSYDGTTLGVKTLGVAMRAEEGQNISVQGGRIILVGDADFLNDRFTSEGSANLAFGLNAVDWLTQDEQLISIRAKSRLPKPMAFPHDAARGRVRYFNVIGVPLIIAVFAGGRLWWRRKKTTV